MLFYNFNFQEIQVSCFRESRKDNWKAILWSRKLRIEGADYSTREEFRINIIEYRFIWNRKCSITRFDNQIIITRNRSTKKGFERSVSISSYFSWINRKSTNLNIWLK